MNTDTDVETLVKMLFSDVVMDEATAIAAQQRAVIPSNFSAGAPVYTPRPRTIDERVSDLVMALVAKRLAGIEIAVNQRLTELDNMVEQIKYQARETARQEAEARRLAQTRCAGVCSPSRYDGLTGGF